MKKIILIPALAFLLMSCGGGGGENTSSSHSTGFVPPVINTFNITWKNYDGAVLRTDQVSYGETPHYGTAPTRSEDECYTYTFKGWSPAIVAATANATYTATYEANPKYQINSAQYEQAMTFKGRSFTLTITSEDHFWDEILYHGENNEIFDKCLDTWDPVQEKGFYDYQRLYKFGDKYDAYGGSDDGDSIDWGYQATKTIDEWISSGYAYDSDQIVGFLADRFEFNNFVYDNATHKYNATKYGWDVSLTFYGVQLREAILSDGAHTYECKFFDYDVTIVPTDESFAEYIVYQYPEKENLQEMARRFDQAFIENVEYELTYKVNNVEVEDYYVITNDDPNNHTYYTQMSYDGTTSYDGVTNKPFVYDWNNDYTYIQVSGNQYTETTKTHQQYDYSNPFEPNIGSPINIAKYFFHENLVNQEVSLETWLSYEKSCGKATFNREFTFIKDMVEHTYDIYFELDVNRNPGDEFGITDFEFHYTDENGDVFSYLVSGISYHASEINIEIVS